MFDRGVDPELHRAKEVCASGQWGLEGRVDGGSVERVKGVGGVGVTNPAVMVTTVQVVLLVDAVYCYFL